MVAILAQITSLWLANLSSTPLIPISGCRGPKRISSDTSLPSLCWGKCLGCPRIARVSSAEELGTMSKRKIRQITLGTRYGGFPLYVDSHIWGSQLTLFHSGCSRSVCWGLLVQFWNSILVVVNWNLSSWYHRPGILHCHCAQLGNQPAGVSHISGHA